jgi:hypothetical protein
VLGNSVLSGSEAVIWLIKTICLLKNKSKYQENQVVLVAVTEQVGLYSDKPEGNIYKDKACISMGNRWFWIRTFNGYVVQSKEKALVILFLLSSSRLASERRRRGA